MKYIIMADGKGRRWNKHKGIEKHFIEIDGEPLIERTIRLLKTYDKNAEIIVTSHNPKYEFTGCTRYEPLSNKIEIDRFTYELIDKEVCFLYGDTLYTEDTMQQIVEKSNSSILFFGTEKKIVAVKIHDPELMKAHIDRVKKLYLDGEIKNCIGWQLYQSIQGLPFENIKIENNFILVDKDTKDFNTPEDCENHRRKNNE